MHAQFRRTIATEANPFARAMEFILTDFQPNANRQAIAPEEAEHIILSARGMPIKYEPVTEGHAGAFPIGVIERVWSGVDSVTNQPCLYASAILWETEYPDLVARLREEFEQTGTLSVSWEIVYETAEERDGVSWLRDVTVVGVAIVEQPAYGKIRTRVLSVASTQEQTMNVDEMQKQLEVLQAEVLAYRAQAEQAQAELRVLQRKQVLAGVLLADVIEQQTPLLRDLNDEQFALYRAALDAVQRAAPAQVAQASVEQPIPRGLPRPASEPFEDETVLLEVLRTL